MSGADYFSEEWGLNCSYTNMQTFELSPYGKVKKDFISAAENLRGIRAITPFAIVLPKKYICVELPELFEQSAYNSSGIGNHRDVYMRSPLSKTEKEYFGHIEDVLKLFFEQYGEKYGNEDHVLTNSRFGDIFDIIYEDADDKTLRRYSYLIDASPDCSFINAKKTGGYRILDSCDLEKLKNQIHLLENDVLPCTVDGLHWLVSVDESGQKYLTVFNNEGNTRDASVGDIINHQADQRVTVTFKQESHLSALHTSGSGIIIEQVNPYRAYVTVPAAGFVVMTF